MEAVNSDADFLTRHAVQIASRFHHTAKILLASSPVWTLMTTAVERAAVGHVVASMHSVLRNRRRTRFCCLSHSHHRLSGRRIVLP